MYNHERLLGGADMGEFWVDLPSKADCGPGVTFSVQVCNDSSEPPHLVICYGLREDVDIAAVRKEASRIVDEYRNTGLRRSAMQGNLIMPDLSLWRSVDDVIQQIRKSEWGWHGNLHDFTGSHVMSERLLERVGGSISLNELIRNSNRCLP